jgi:hypothetical protein
MGNPELPDPDCGEYLAQLKWRFAGDDEPTGQREKVRPKRAARSGSSIAYCECGGPSKVIDNGDWRNRIDINLGQIRRQRVCKDCGALWNTVEQRESEVNELRRLAYLWRLHECT